VPGGGNARLNIHFRIAAGDAGNIAEDVEPAMVLLGLRDDRRPRCLITDVLSRERRRTTVVGYLACDALAQGGVAVGQQHLRPVQREDARRLGADPRRTSGHDRDLADQSFARVHGCLPRPPQILPFRLRFSIP
jgi:hypothetical protein